MQTAAQTSIKASELRIGNWVNSKLVFHFPERVVYRPTRILAYHFQVNDEDCFHPIPLTPEILEKCGFSYLGNGSYENGHMFDKIFVYKRNTLSIGIMLMAGGKLSISFNTNFKTNASMRIYEGSEYYLHQLQNLYFALTGEELDIKFYDSRSNTTSA